WFCDAYASWQKGGVENANGRLRRWLPRHIDIDRLSDAEIQDIVITAHFRRSSKSLAKTLKSASLEPVALRPRIHVAPELSSKRSERSKMFRSSTGFPMARNMNGKARAGPFSGSSSVH